MSIVVVVVVAASSDLVSFPLCPFLYLYASLSFLFFTRRCLLVLRTKLKELSPGLGLVGGGGLEGGGLEGGGLEGGGFVGGGAVGVVGGVGLVGGGSIGAITGAPVRGR